MLSEGDEDAVVESSIKGFGTKMSDEDELDADKQNVPPPSWICIDGPLIVMDGNHNKEYTAMAKSKPFFEDGAWYVRVKYTLSCHHDVVECSKCLEINMKETGRSRLRKRNKKPIMKRTMSYKVKLDKKPKKKGSGGRRVRRPPNKPPSVVGLTAGSDSEVQSLASFSISELERLCEPTSDENEARIPSPEDRESDDDDDSEILMRDSLFPPSVAPSPGMARALASDKLEDTDEDSDLNKKPAARGSWRSTKKCRCGSVTQVSIDSDVDRDTVKKKPAPRNALRKHRQMEAIKVEGCKKQFEAAKEALQNFSFSNEEVDHALEQIGPPYTMLQTAVMAMQRRQNEGKTKEQLELFDVEIGMTVKKPFHGKLFEGVVLYEVQELVIKHGEYVKVWKVVYEDGDQEELEFDELLRHRWPPLEVSQCRGRAMQALELFCGSGVVSQEFRFRTWKVISLDIDERSNATLVADIMNIEPQELAFVPDFIWASLPCHTYSKAAGNTHRNAKRGEFEKSPESRRNNFLFCRMVKFMNWAKKLHPHLIVVIENPVGQLAFMPLMVRFCTIPWPVVYHCVMYTPHDGVSSL